MREKWQKQMPLMAHIKDHPPSKELEAISTIIDATPTICEKVLQDLNRGKAQPRRTGANGMSADQVLRCAIVKVLFNFTYLVTLIKMLQIPLGVVPHQNFSGAGEEINGISGWTQIKNIFAASDILRWDSQCVLSPANIKDDVMKKIVMGMALVLCLRRRNPLPVRRCLSGKTPLLTVR